MQDCSNYIKNALELLQLCTKPSIWRIWTYDSSSGTEEEYGERQQLLTELRELEDERKVIQHAAATAGRPAAKKNDDALKEAQGEAIRKRAMEAMADGEILAICLHSSRW